MVTVSLILYVAIFAPIVVSPLVYYDKTVKKLFFAVSVYGIPVLGGYIKRRSDVIYIHISDKKAFAVRIKPGGNTFGVKGLSAIDILKANLIINASISESGIIFCGLIEFATATLQPIFKTNKPFADVRQTINIGNTDDLQLFFKLTAVFNLVSVIKILLKNVRGKK